MACAALVLSPAAVSVVLISINSFKMSRARASCGLRDDCWSASVPTSHIHRRTDIHPPLRPAFIPAEIDVVRQLVFVGRRVVRKVRRELFTDCFDALHQA